MPRKSRATLVRRSVRRDQMAGLTFGERHGLRMAQVVSNENYCKHGTYLGNPYGADHICGRCENGE